MFSKIAKIFGFLPSVKKRRKTLIGGIILLLLGLVYLWNYDRQYDYSPHGFSETEVAKQEGKIKITANTDLIQKTRYLKCMDEEILRTKPADDLIGLNYSQTQKIYPKWNIEKFDTDEVEMTLEINSMCREHANNIFIGIRDGYVAVFYGVPGPKAILKEVTNIPLSKIMPEDLKEISSGLRVSSREELLRTLEGMHER